MELVLKNTSIRLEYRQLVWVEQTFDQADIVSIFIYQMTTWSAGGTCYFITRSSNMKKIRVKSNSSRNTGLAFLKTNAHDINTTPTFCNETSFISVPLGGNEQTFDIPDNCNYIYVMDGTEESGVGGHLPELVEIGEYQ